MRSRASIKNHPIHPALVAIPVGAFFLVMIADLGYLMEREPFWAEMASVALWVGIIAALGAAVTGFIDYLGLPAGSSVRSTATVHMVVNLLAVTLFSCSLYLRFTAEGIPFIPSVAALALSFLAFFLLSAGGWLGGKMVFEMRAGVLEPLAERT